MNTPESTPQPPPPAATEADRALAFSIWKDAGGRTEMSVVQISERIHNHTRQAVSQAVGAKDAEIERLRCKLAVFKNDQRRREIENGEI